MACHISDQMKVTFLLEPELCLVDIPSSVTRLYTCLEIGFGPVISVLFGLHKTIKVK